MPRYEVLLLVLKAIWLAFVFAFGACIGSLINVIVYRLPRGLNIVTPPSRCPACNTRLTWRENIPVLGWILLRGRCRFCRAPISPEYPIVEAAVGLLFALFYALYYVVPADAVWLGIHWGAIRPEWAAYPNPADQTWPAFVVILLLVGSLAAMTIVDAKTYTIPLSLTWFPAIAALVIHPIHAAWIGNAYGGLRRAAPGWWWTIPTPGPGPDGWRTILMAVGAVIGLGLSIVLVHSRLLRRSFADYDEWEKSHIPAPGPGDPAGPVTPDVTVPTSTSPADVWVQYPHARREMIYELLFLAPCFALAMLGWYAAGSWLVGGPPPPLWARVLGGVLLGYLIGGGVVWAVRILGSLAFGKEAMGLGDVHLMAAVGACLGWIDSSLAFFLAAFVGLGWAMLSRVFSGVFRRAMPYGPFLAIATVLVLLGKPVIEVFLSRLLPAAGPINIP